MEKPSRGGRRIAGHGPLHESEVAHAPHRDRAAPSRQHQSNQRRGRTECQQRDDAPPPYADAVAVQGMLTHWEQTLADIGFLDPAAPKKLMPRLAQLANRTQLTAEEIHILRGIAKAAARQAQNR